LVIMNNDFTLKVENVSKKYTHGNGKSICAIKDINFSVTHGEFISIVGPSGCGKSTLIKILADLIKPTTGTIIENKRTDPDMKKNHGVVFQQYTLFPWLNVQENIGFGLDIIGASRIMINDIVSHYIEVMGLQGFENAYPKELSGGMQQRVALARTLATNPKILLMDEPFTALDVQTRRFMQDLLLQILHNEPRTVIFVTHDVEEAVFLSDLIYVMSPGPGTIIEKVKVPLSRPRTLTTEFSDKFVAIKKHVQKIITKESLNLIKLNLEIYQDL
jgi:NitT/TauT family transport system ATP-binding protein